MTAALPPAVKAQAGIRDPRTWSWGRASALGLGDFSVPSCTRTYASTCFVKHYGLQASKCSSWTLQVIGDVAFNRAVLFAAGVRLSQLHSLFQRLLSAKLGVSYQAAVRHGPSKIERGLAMQKSKRPSCRGHAQPENSRPMGLASTRKVLRVFSPDVLSQYVGGRWSAPV